MLTRVLLTVLVLVFGSGLTIAADDEPKTTVVSFGITDHKVDEAELLKRRALPKPRFNSPGVAYGWVAHAKKGETDKAMEYFQSALKLNPRPERVYYEMGKVHESKGELDKAVENYKLALAQLLGQH